MSITVKSREILRSVAGVVVKEVKSKIDQSACRRLPINLDMRLLQMPATRANQKRSRLTVQLVGLVASLVLVRDSPVHGIS